MGAGASGKILLAVQVLPVISALWCWSCSAWFLNWCSLVVGDGKDNTAQPSLVALHAAHAVSSATKCMSIWVLSAQYCKLDAVRLQLRWHDAAHAVAGLALLLHQQAGLLSSGLLMATTMVSSVTYGAGQQQHSLGYSLTYIAGSRTPANEWTEYSLLFARDW